MAGIRATLQLAVDDLATLDAAAHELREFAETLRGSGHRHHADHVAEVAVEVYGILGRAATGD